MIERRRWHNDAIPVHRLPLEIQLRAISLSLRNLPIKAYYPQLHRFAQVSVRWAALILGSPSMWQKLWQGLPPALFRQALARSKAAPIECIRRV